MVTVTHFLHTSEPIRDDSGMNFFLGTIDCGSIDIQLDYAKGIRAVAYFPNPLG